MKKIVLKEKNQSAHKDFDPVEISEGVTIEILHDIHNDNYVVEGNLNKNGKDFGRFALNENQGRYFVNIPLDGLKRNTKREIVEAVTAIMLNLIPEETEEEAD